MHTTINSRRGRAVSGLLAVALATVAMAGSALGFANSAHAMSMPDWAAEFDAAGDAFGSNGGGPPVRKPLGQLGPDKRCTPMPGNHMVCTDGSGTWDCRAEGFLWWVEWKCIRR